MIQYKTSPTSIVIPSTLAVGVHLLLAYIWWSLTPAVTVLSAPPSAMRLLLIAPSERHDQPVTELAPLNATGQTDTLSKTDIMSKADVTSKIDTQAPKKLITSTEITQVPLAQEGLAESAKPPTNTPLTPPIVRSNITSNHQAKSVTQPEPAKKTPVKLPSKATTQPPTQSKHRDATLLTIAEPIVDAAIASFHASIAPAADTAPAVEVLAAQPLTTAPPKYPHRAIMRNQQGLVVMRFHVSAAGKASNLQLLRSSGHRLLDQAVVKYIESGLFKAATRAGVAVGSEQEFRFRFQLQ